MVQRRGSIGRYSISLVELTNAHINKENVPLFVFEMDEQALKMKWIKTIHG